MRILPRMAKGFHRKVIFPFLSILLPADCFVCGLPLGPVHLLGACLGCWGGLSPIRPPICGTCGAPLPRGTNLLGPAGGRCAPCLLRPSTLDGVRAGVIYDPVARRFVLRAKFGRRRELLQLMGDHLGRLLAASNFGEECTVVVPVPSHPWILLRRGFNPALEIARPVARSLRLPLRAGALGRRIRRAASVKGLRASRRRRALEGAFRPLRSAVGERILLVDDVYTTGATAEACGHSLRVAGAETVRLIVWARTPRLRATPSSTYMDDPRPCPKYAKRNP